MLLKLVFAHQREMWKTLSDLQKLLSPQVPAAVQAPRKIRRRQFPPYFRIGR